MQTLKQRCAHRGASATMPRVLRSMPPLGTRASDRAARLRRRRPRAVGGKRRGPRFRRTPADERPTPKNDGRSPWTAHGSTLAREVGRSRRNSSAWRSSASWAEVGSRRVGCSPRSARFPRRDSFARRPRRAGLSRPPAGRPPRSGGLRGPWQLRQRLKRPDWHRRTRTDAATAPRMQSRPKAWLQRLASPCPARRLGQAKMMYRARTRECPVMWSWAGSLQHRCFGQRAELWTLRALVRRLHQAKMMSRARPRVQPITCFRAGRLQHRVSRPRAELWTLHAPLLVLMSRARSRVRPIMCFRAGSVRHLFSGPRAELWTLSALYLLLVSRSSSRPRRNEIQ